MLRGNAGQNFFLARQQNLWRQSGCGKFPVYFDVFGSHFSSKPVTLTFSSSVSDQG
jgi:hypothetical protein